MSSATRREPVGLGGLFSEASDGDDDAAGHVELAVVQFDVTPAESAQLAPAHPGQGGQHQQGCQSGISLLGGGDHGTDRLDRGSVTRRCLTCGGRARSATFSRTHPQRTAWWRADEMVAW